MGSTPLAPSVYLACLYRSCFCCPYSQPPPSWLFWSTLCEVWGRRQVFSTLWWVTDLGWRMRVLCWPGRWWGAGCGVCPSQGGRHPLSVSHVLPLACPTYAALWVPFAGGHPSTAVAAGPRLPPLCETTDVVHLLGKFKLCMQGVGAEVYRIRTRAQAYPAFYGF